MIHVPLWGWLILAVGALLAWRSLRSREPLPPGDDPGTLVGLVAAGHKVEAVRRYRARHGGGLKDAKEAVEALAAGRAVPALAHPIPDLEPPVVALIRAGRKVEAIAAYREAHPEASLTDAKAAMEAWVDRNGGG